MLPRGGKSLWIALVACVQLALAPAFRPVPCGGGAAEPGGASCCAAARVDSRSEPPALGMECCCGGENETPARPPERERGDEPCPCHHAPQPWVPADDAAITVSGDAGPNLVAAEKPGITLPVPRPTDARFGVRTGPPTRAGPALHVLHCVFLI